MNDVLIIDYGLCNLKSIENAFKYLDIKAVISSNPNDLNNYNHIILPGVGAFKDGMQGLKRAGFLNPLKESVSKNKIILGICLGMQMLLTESYEFGKHKGLGFIDGIVKPFKPIKENDNYIVKVPQIGWNSIKVKKSWLNTPFSKTSNNEDMYFVHSFYCKVNNEEDVLATTEYANVNFHSIIASKNVFGCQFHPERSGDKGLVILEEFSKLNI